MIDFCRKLVEHTGGIENLEVRDNKDGTRSILKRVDKKLLVTFKAENQVSGSDINYQVFNFKHYLALMQKVRELGSQRASHKDLLADVRCSLAAVRCSLDAVRCSLAAVK